MTIEEYIEQRLDNQRKYYSDKSAFNQKWHRRLRSATILIAGLLPVVTAYLDQHIVLKILAGTMGATIAIIEGVQHLNKYQENWVNYRRTSEALKSEKIMFQTHTGAYAQDASLANLVARVEGILTNENQQWTEYIKESNKES
jgi:Protein of unknown function (DUF4231)